jgi:hypothetical protein
MRCTPVGLTHTTAPASAPVVPGGAQTSAATIAPRVMIAIGTPSGIVKRPTVDQSPQLGHVSQALLSFPRSPQELGSRPTGGSTTQYVDAATGFIRQSLVQ